MAYQKLLSLQAVLVGAVADLQGSRDSVQAELYMCMLSKIADLHGERPASRSSSASSPCKWNI